MSGQGSNLPTHPVLFRAGVRQRNAIDFYPAACIRRVNLIVEIKMTNQDNPFPLFAKLLHAGIAFFGISAFLSGELAENGTDTTGFYLHAYLGLSLAAFILLRVYRGITATAPMRCSAPSSCNRPRRN